MAASASPSAYCLRQCWLPVAAAWLVIAVAGTRPVQASLMYDDVELTWGEEHSFFFMDGDGGRSETLALCLDGTRGSGFKSKDAYLYGRFDVDMKLVAGNSAGLITTFYVSSVPYLSTLAYTCQPVLTQRQARVDDERNAAHTGRRAVGEP
jgi:hypothetical protein